MYTVDLPGCLPRFNNLYRGLTMLILSVFRPINYTSGPW